MQKIPFTNEFKDFHDFYDQRYKENKGKTVILIEFGICIELYLLLIVSFYQVCTTNPGNISDDEVIFLKK